MTAAGFGANVAVVLTIRNAQIAVFAKQRREHFVRRAVGHVQESFPERAAELGDVAVEQSVRGALDRCRAYGLPSERDVLRYLNLMYALGFDFDTDARLPWAGQTLRDARLEAGAKLGLLAQRARELLRAREKGTR